MSEVAESMALTVEDRLILSKESPTVVGHTCKVILVGPTLDIAQLRASLEHRVGAVPVLARRLGGERDAPAWVPTPEFRVDDHFVDATMPVPLTAAEMNGEVARLFVQRLDRQHPLWRIDVLGPLEDGTFALVWRIHHALADGAASMRFAEALLWDTGGALASPKPHLEKAAATALEEHQRHRRTMVGFLDREFRRDPAPSPFDGRIGTERLVAFTSIELGALRRAARAIADATVNDAVLACVTGGMRRWLAATGGALSDLRVKVPVSLHQADDSLGNRDSAFYLGLPLGESDPAERLRLIRRESALRKTNHDAEEMDRVLTALSRVSTRLRLLCERFQFDPREFALNVSNVRGPADPVSIVGQPVLSIHSIADIAERHALRVAVTSYEDQLNVGACADAALVPDLPGLVVDIRAEAEVLIGMAAP
jgi:hypothetical protein